MRCYAVLPLLLVACKHPDPAPQDIDGLAHWFWVNYDAGTDEEMAAAVVALDAAIQDASKDTFEDADGYKEEAIQVTISDLSTEERDVVPMDVEKDPADARGMLIINPLPCTVEQVERFTYELNQDELYPDAYDAYSRTYTSDADAYIAREVPTLSWEVDLTGTTIGVTYTEHLNGGIRWVPALDDEQSPFGAIAVNRTWMPTPATFANENNREFDQDYQIEVQYETTPGLVVHFYAIWRHVDYGAGMDSENDGLVNTQMDGIVDWDDVTAALCQAE